eukprot:m.359908 g.359908  ORF g.359908 m.359908 type:complete len:218 (+) comp18814_c0_seq1:131-784(+)
MAAADELKAIEDEYISIKRQLLLKRKTQLENELKAVQVEEHPDFVEKQVTIYKTYFDAVAAAAKQRREEVALAKEWLTFERTATDTTVPDRIKEQERCFLDNLYAQLLHLREMKYEMEREAPPIPDRYISKVTPTATRPHLWQKGSQSSNMPFVPFQDDGSVPPGTRAFVPAGGRTPSKGGQPTPKRKKRSWFEGLPMVYRLPDNEIAEDMALFARV